MITSEGKEVKGLDCAVFLVSGMFPTIADDARTEVAQLRAVAAGLIGLLRENNVDTILELRGILDGLRAAIVEAQRERDFNSGIIDGLNVAIKIKDDEIESQAARIAALREHNARLVDSNLLLDAETKRQREDVRDVRARIVALKDRLTLLEDTSETGRKLAQLATDRAWDAAYLAGASREVLNAIKPFAPASEAEQAISERIDRVAQKIHSAWMEYNIRNGCASRCSFWGEELMRPWDELSERAKELDRATVKAALEIVQVTP